MPLLHISFATPRWLVLAALGVLTLGACGGETAETDAARDTLAVVDTAPRAGQPAGQPLGADTAALTDGGIAAILSAADQAEIQPSQLAQQRAQNAQVREFAQRMVTDHTALSDSLRALTQRQNITPQENALSRQLQAQTDSVRQRLQGLSGAEFDREYMQYMVQSHQMTLNTIDQRLLPSAQNPQLRTAIEQQVRPAVANHLRDAQQLQGTVGTR